MSKFDFNAITLQSPADISRVGENFEKIEANAVTEEVFDTALEGKADLGPDGKVPASQLPPAEAIQDATLTQKGIAQLANSVTSESTSTAAVPASVKVAYDKGVEAKSAADTAQATANAHAGRTDNPHGVTKSQVGLGNVDNTSDANKPISTAVQNALNAKEPALPLGTAAQYMRGDKVLASFADAVSAVAPAPKFIYNCTGVNDDLAVQTLVNNFFTAAAGAMSVKLIISGTMGLQASPANNRHINISAENTRGAVCYLDFSDCSIPEITTANRDFFYISGASAKVDVTGLYVTTTRKGVFIDSLTSNANFYNCIISGIYGVDISFSSSNNISFNNCAINGGSYGVFVLSVTGNIIYNNCVINGGSYGFTISSSSSNNNFNNCTINGGVAISGNAENINFNNCVINGGSYGVSFSANFARAARFVACTIIGTTIGINVAVSNTFAEIKLIGCRIRGSTQDIEQTTAANTVKWYIMGCSFSRANIIADGTTGITQKLSASIYMPQYANFFSRTIA